MVSSRQEYILTQFSVLITYLRLFVWPANQNIDWDYPLTTSFFALKTVSSLLFLLLLLFLYQFLKKNRLLNSYASVSSPQLSQLEGLRRNHQ